MNYMEPLTPREQDVLALVAQGYANKEIAELLVITVNTVQSHLRSILGKLGVKSRTQAVFKAYHFIPRAPGLFCEKAQRETSVEYTVVSVLQSYTAHDEQPSPHQWPLTSDNLSK